MLPNRGQYSTDVEFLHSLDRSKLDHAEAALSILQAKSVDALKMRTQSRNYAQTQMRHYLERLNLDISSLNVVHVAGSKGKGSTSAFIETILHQSGYKTGLYTSPHLVSLTERFRLHTQYVSDDLFLTHFWRVWDGLWSTRGLRTDESIPEMPSFFAFLTLVAFDMYVAQQVDVLVLEVGLGGRLDSTNVVCDPLVCVLTYLTLEHTEILGNSLALIAEEKTGIFKPNVPVISTIQHSETTPVIFKNAVSNGVLPLFVRPLNDPSQMDTIGAYPNDHVHTGGASFDAFLLGLHGQHQWANAALAVTACAVATKELHKRRVNRPLQTHTHVVDNHVESLRASLAVSWANASVSHRDRVTYTLDSITHATQHGHSNQLLSQYVEDAYTSIVSSKWGHMLRPEFDPACINENSVSDYPVSSAIPRASQEQCSLDLPPAYLAGLTTTAWAGRCQTVVCGSQQDTALFTCPSAVSFHLDGAHTQQSIKLCEQWFAETTSQHTPTHVFDDSSDNVLLFNCGHVRSPFSLLAPLAPASSDVSFAHTVFTCFDHDKLHILPPPAFESLLAQHQAEQVNSGVCVDAATDALIKDVYREVMSSVVNEREYQYVYDSEGSFIRQFNKSREPANDTMIDHNNIADERYLPLSTNPLKHTSLIDLGAQFRWQGGLLATWLSITGLDQAASLSSHDVRYDVYTLTRSVKYSDTTPSRLPHIYGGEYKVTSFGGRHTHEVDSSACVDAHVMAVPPTDIETNSLLRHLQAVFPSQQLFVSVPPLVTVRKSFVPKLNAGHSGSSYPQPTYTHICASVSSSTALIQQLGRNRPGRGVRGLVTGSLYLVGNVLKALGVKV